MNEEYIQARFREYYPQAAEIRVSLDVTETWSVHIVQPFADNDNLKDYPDQHWIYQVGSEDERLTFTRDQHSPDFDHFMDIITLPFKPDPVEPAWRREPFTDEDRKLMLIVMTEEIRDSAKAFAEEVLDAEPLVDLVAYADEDPGTTHDMLKAIIDHNAGMDDYRSGEHEDHVSHAAFMDRMGLVDSVGDVTPLGRQYIERFG